MEFTIDTVAKQEEAFRALAAVNAAVTARKKAADDLTDAQVHHDNCCKDLKTKKDLHVKLLNEFLVASEAELRAATAE